MTQLENRVHRLIQSKHGITFEQVRAELNTKASSLRKAIPTLRRVGLVSLFQGKLYPNFRSIEVFEKVRDEVVDEIRLNYLSPQQIYKYIKHAEEDYWYCNTYLIDESSAPLFVKTNKIKFDFDKYEYWLTYSMDTSDDISKA